MGRRRGGSGADDGPCGALHGESLLPRGLKRGKPPPTTTKEFRRDDEAHELYARAGTSSIASPMMFDRRPTLAADVTPTRAAFDAAMARGQ